MNKKPLAIIGSCLMTDVLNADTHQLRNYTYDWNTRYQGSIIRGLVPPGKIAERLYHDMYRQIENIKTKILNKDPMEWYEYQILIQYSMVLKEPDIKSLIFNNDLPLILVDYGYEFINHYNFNHEEIDIHPNWNLVKSYFPNWFRLEIEKHLYKFDTTKTSTLQRHHRYKDFISYLEKSKKPVILLDDTFTPFSFDSHSNTVVKNLSLFNKEIPFFVFDQDGQEITLNSEMALNVFNSFFSVAKKLFSKIDNCYWLPVDKNTCFTDLNHRFGYHPAHLHHFSRAIIAKDLYALMNEHYSRIIL